MRTAIIFSDGMKQIVFTPENDDEKMALKFITPNDNIELAVYTGSFGENRIRPFTPSINKCQGGFLRVYDGSESIMLVLTPKDKKEE